MARLEFFDCKEPAARLERLGSRRGDKTVVRLADCTSVAPVPESGPRAGTVVFRLETSDRSYLFAADKEQSEEWVAKLCEIAFPVSAGTGRGAAGAQRSVCGGRGLQGGLAARGGSPPALRSGLWWSEERTLAPRSSLEAPAVPAVRWVAGLLDMFSVSLGCSCRFQVELFSPSMELVLGFSRDAGVPVMAEEHFSQLSYCCLCCCSGKSRAPGALQSLPPAYTWLWAAAFSSLLCSLLWAAALHQSCGLRAQLFTPLHERSQELPFPMEPLLFLLGNVCALGCDLADSRL